MITIFKNIERTMYGGLEGYPKTLLLLNSLLNKNKIKEVKDMYESRLNDEDLFEDDLTILLNPSVSGGVSKQLDTHLRSYLRANNFTSVRGDHHLFNLKNEEIRIELEIEGTKRNCVIGYYFRERNVIIIHFNLFKYNWSDDNKFFLEIFNKLLNSLSKLKPRRVDVKDAIENAKIEKFMVSLKTNLNNLRDNKTTYTNDITTYNKTILERMSDLETTEIQIDSLKKLLKNKSEIITKKLNEIRELPFAKNVKLTKQGIMVDLGMILMNHNKQRTKLGRYRVYIKSNEVKIYNLDAIKTNGGGWYDHPHVSNTNPCLGSWNDKVNKMIHGLELKNLILTIKLYLQSYNNDSPHLNWTSWGRYRKKQPIREKDKAPNGDEPQDNRTYTNKLREEDLIKLGRVESSDDD